MFSVSLTSERVPLPATGRLDCTVALLLMVFGTSTEVYVVVEEPGVPTTTGSEFPQVPWSALIAMTEVMVEPHVNDAGTWNEKWFGWVFEDVPAVRLGQGALASDMT